MVKKRKEQKRKNPMRPDSVLDKKKPDQLPRRISGFRLWLFRMIACLILPVLMFAGVEGFLHIIDFGYSPDAFIKFEYNKKNGYRNNNYFARRFFPPMLARESHNIFFSARKPSGTYRIFILGASAAQGVPEQAFSFGRVLEVMLEAQFPETDFEILNTAMPAINSHVVLEIAKECTNFEPDLMIVYLGNNEVVGPYGAGTVFSPALPSLMTIRTNVFVRKTRIGQLIETLFESFLSNRSAPETWGGMEMFMNNQVRHDSQSLQWIYNHFEENLSDICTTASRAGAQMILCTVAVNSYHNPPFSSLHSLDITEDQKIRWESYYNKGVAFEEEKNPAKALEMYESASEIDETYADLQFRIACMAEQISDVDRAGESYIKALNYDTLRFRADPQINEIIRRVGKKKADKGIVTLDIERALREESRYLLPGKDFFYEHAHYNFHGNYQVGKKLYQSILPLLPQSINLKKTGHDVLTEGDCAQKLAYTDWERFVIQQYVLDNFIKKPPFTSQIYHEQFIQDMETELTEIKKQFTPALLQEIDLQYENAVQQRPNDWDIRFKYAGFLESALSDSKRAVTQYEAILREFPSHMAFSRLGRHFMRSDPDKAISCFRQAIQIQPNSGTTVFNLAMLMHMVKKNYPEAIRYYTRAIRIDPRCSETAYSNLAVVLNETGQKEKACDVFEEGLSVFPDSANLYFGYGVLLNTHNRTDEAVKYLEKAIEIQPDHSKAQIYLQHILQNR